MRNIKIRFLLIIIIILLNQCTKNPFSNEDNNKIKKEKIKGKVTLSDGVVPDNIFVWIEKFDLSTSTDENGEFSITLPLPESQAEGNGYSGKFGVYYFMGNYEMDSTTVEFVEGKLLEDQVNVNNNGRIKKTEILDPCMNFETEDLFTIIFDSDTILEFIDVTLKLYDETQVVYSLREDVFEVPFRFFRTGMIFEPLNNDYETLFIESPKAFLYHNALIRNSSNLWTFELTLASADFVETDYIIYPYLIVDQPFVPEGLLDAMGREKMEFGPDYLEYPIKKKAKVVTIEK